MDSSRKALLLQQAYEGHIEGRVGAIHELSKNSDEEIPLILYKLLDDPDSYVRMNVAVALGKFPSFVTLQRLVDALEKHFPQARTDDEGRAVEAILVTLRQLSGFDLGYDPARWREWIKSSPE